jgi:hypothetical protein
MRRIDKPLENDYYKADTPRCKFLRIRLTQLLTADLVSVVLSYNSDLLDNFAGLVKTVQERVLFPTTNIRVQPVYEPVPGLKFMYNKIDTLDDNPASTLKVLRTHSLRFWFVNADKVFLFMPNGLSANVDSLVREPISLLLSDIRDTDIADILYSINREYIHPGVIETVCGIMAYVRMLKSDLLI